MNIERIYNEVVTGCKYDFEVASKHNMEMVSSDVKASELPHIEANFVAQNHVGCCLHYGMTLFAKLREQNIECYIAITKEENPNTHQKTDNHVSVCYLKNGKKFIADPVETVIVKKTTERLKLVFRSSFTGVRTLSMPKPLSFLRKPL